jgi:hypothetical protein
VHCSHGRSARHFAAQPPASCAFETRSTADPPLPPHKVFDCGLIGEGALHIAAAVAARRLLARGGALLPARATVFAQPLEFDPIPAAYDPSSAGGAAPPPATGPLDLRPLGAYAWGASGGAAGEYAAHDLAAGLAPGGPPAAAAAIGAPRAPRWRALAAPQAVFEFDFAGAAAAAAAAAGAAEAAGGGAAAAADAAAAAAAPLLAPSARDLAFPVTAAGACNAVASWFELDLLGDGSLRLTTSPYAGAAAAAAGPAGGGGSGGAAYAPSWRQAVHPLLPARGLEAGGTLAVRASHDSYSLRFEATPEPAAPAVTASPAVASAEPAGGGGSTAQSVAGAAAAAWEAAAAEARALQAQLARQAAQRPGAHRRVARAALELAAAPAAGGADARQAVALAAAVMM